MRLMYLSIAALAITSAVGSQASVASAKQRAVSGTTVEILSIPSALNVYLSPAHGVASAHEGLAGAVLDHRIGRVVTEEAVEIAGVVGIHRWRCPNHARASRWRVTSAPEAAT